jgi:urease accessory protein
MNMVAQHMTTDILTLSQLLSPSFPVGAFAYSHGLETTINDGVIHDASSLQDWLHDLLHFGSAQSDAVLLNMAYADDVNEVDSITRAFAASAERLKETDLQGAAFSDTVRDVWDIDLGRLCYPVAVGQAARCLGLDPTLTTAMYLQAFVANLTAAAIRLVPLGQVDGQKVQTALKPDCVTIAADCTGATADNLNNCAWGSDIAAMRHETQYSRVFRT